MEVESVNNERKEVNMKNVQIRKYAQSRGVYLWEIAQHLSVSEMTVTRKLRKQLNSEDTSNLQRIIDEIALKKEKEV